MQNSRTVVFILCQPHSGSTLIGNMLGSASNSVHLGEVVAPVKKGKRLACRICADEPCPIWGGALNPDTVTKKVKQFLHSQKTGWRSLLPLTSSKPYIYPSLFENIPNLEVVIDSSKNIDWFEYQQARAKGYTVKVLYLLRDMRGVWASRKRNFPDKYETYLQKLEEVQSELIDRMGKLPATDLFTVQYESVMTEPEAFAEQMEWFLGLRESKRMLEYYKYPHHLAGGNNSPLIQYNTYHNRQSEDLLTSIPKKFAEYYEDHPPALVLDERWKHELSANDLKAFDDKLGSLNQQLGYAPYTP